MTKGKIYLINEGSSEMVALEESGYLAEVNLQAFLAQHPDLLPGDQIDPDNPRRWLLVSREMGVPGSETESGRWSLDHLFIDHDAVPTFVECKRSSDTRIRREVVSQMLDYAANGSQYWNIDRIRQVAAETAEQEERSLDEEVMALLQAEDVDAIDEFWSRVEANLRSHRVRLIFVSDHAPRELRRLVEFLNEEMINVEVLIVEVKQYKNPEHPTERALVPRVLGLTETARSAKAGGSRAKRLTTRTEFLDKCVPEARDFFSDLLDQTESYGYVVNWGEVGFSIRARLGEGGRLATFQLCYPPHTYQYYFHGLGLPTREKTNEFRQELLDLGVFRESGNFTLTSIVTTENVEEIIEVRDLIFNRIREFEDEISSKGTNSV